MTRHKCPQCHAMTAWEDNPHRPFCSERCRMIDLGNWADESYRIPAEPADAEDLEKIVSIDDFRNRDLKGNG